MASRATNLLGRKHPYPGGRSGRDVLEQVRPAAEMVAVDATDMESIPSIVHWQMRSRATAGTPSG